jgi:hypothetical protein
MSKSSIVRIQETEPPDWISMPWWLGVFVTLFFLGLTFSSVFLAFSMAMFMGSSVLPPLPLPEVGADAMQAVPIALVLAARYPDPEHLLRAGVEVGGDVNPQPNQ